MRKEFTKYFWGFNKGALAEALNALKDLNHPQFAYYAVILFSRCDNPKEAFKLISRNNFILGWPRIKTYWRRLKKDSEFRDWWQAIYERLIEEKDGKVIRFKSPGSSSFRGIGAKIRDGRLKLNMSQQDLARLSRIRQPDISKIEEGKKNITLETLLKICKIIGLKEIQVSEEKD